MLEPFSNLNSDKQYSADVSMYIETSDKKLEVAGCHENSCILRDPIDLDPFDGILYISIDDEVYQTSIRVAKGISSECSVAEFVEIQKNEQLSFSFSEVLGRIFKK